MNHTMRKLALGGLMALSLAACDKETKENLGLATVAPDEFAVVTRAPLSVPPDYALRPPVPGKQRPMELSTQAEARQTVFGVKDVDQAGVAKSDASMSGGFLDRVGANNADSSIRDVIDAEAVNGADDNRPVAEKLMFWSSDDDADKGTPIDPKEEMQRLEQEGITTIKKRNEDVEAP